MAVEGSTVTIAWPEKCAPGDEAIVVFACGGKMRLQLPASIGKFVQFTVPAIPSTKKATHDEATGPKVTGGAKRQQPGVAEQTQTLVPEQALVPAGHALTPAQGKIAAGYLRVRLDPVRGVAQWDGGRCAELVQAVNVLLETAGEAPVYTLENLKSWIKNALQRKQHPCRVKKRLRAEAPAAVVDLRHAPLRCCPVRCRRPDLLPRPLKSISPRQTYSCTRSPPCRELEPGTRVRSPGTYA